MPAPLTWDSPTNLTWDSGLTWDSQTNNNTNTTMPNDNRISAEVTAANKTAILTKITEIKALLPFLINLTKDERITLPKLGASSLEFDEQCASYMASAPNLVPPFVTAIEVTKDCARAGRGQTWGGQQTQGVGHLDFGQPGRFSFHPPQLLTQFVVRLVGSDGRIRLT